MMHYSVLILSGHSSVFSIYVLKKLKKNLSMYHFPCSALSSFHLGPFRIQGNGQTPHEPPNC